MLTSLLTHALRMGSNINKSTSSENETISNFKFSKNVELRKKKLLLLTVACNA